MRPPLPCLYVATKAVFRLDGFDIVNPSFSKALTRLAWALLHSDQPARCEREAEEQTYTSSNPSSGFSDAYQLSFFYLRSPQPTVDDLAQLSHIRRDGIDSRKHSILDLITDDLRLARGY